MRPTSSRSALLTQVELTLLAARNLEQVELELLASGHVAADERAKGVAPRTVPRRGTLDRGDGRKTTRRTLAPRRE